MQMASIQKRLTSWWAKFFKADKALFGAVTFWPLRRIGPLWVSFPQQYEIAV
jgi:hypothetical protein